MGERCKHCGLAIEGYTSVEGGHWLHTEGPQRGLHRCAINPYGYNAAPARELCDPTCLGHRRDLAGER